MSIVHVEASLVNSMLKKKPLVTRTRTSHGSTLINPALRHYHRHAIVKVSDSMLRAERLLAKFSA